MWSYYGQGNLLAGIPDENMRIYDSLTMYRKVGCGTIYCIFSEQDGNFYNLIIKGDNAKEIVCGESWMNSIASVLTYALRRSISEGNAHKGIVKHLLGHRCNMYVPNKDKIQSCGDAIGRMCLEYLKARTDEIEKEEETKAETISAVT